MFMCPRELSHLGPEVIFDSYFSSNKYPFSYQTLDKSILGCGKGFSHKLILTGDLWWVDLRCFFSWTSLHDHSLKYSGLKSLCECPIQLEKDFMFLEWPAAQKSHLGCENVPFLCQSPVSDIIASACGMSSPSLEIFMHRVLLLSWVRGAQKYPHSAPQSLEW